MFRTRWGLRWRRSPLLMARLRPVSDSPRARCRPLDELPEDDDDDHHREPSDDWRCADGGHASARQNDEGRQTDSTPPDGSEIYRAESTGMNP